MSEIAYITKKVEERLALFKKRLCEKSIDKYESWLFDIHYEKRCESEKYEKPGFILTFLSYLIESDFQVEKFKKIFLKKTGIAVKYLELFHTQYNETECDYEMVVKMINDDYEQYCYCFSGPKNSLILIDYHMFTTFLDHKDLELLSNMLK